jgi:hypothetical protein
MDVKIGKTAKHGRRPEDWWTQERVHQLRTSTIYFSKSPVSDILRQFEEKKLFSIVIQKVENRYFHS